MQGEKGFLERGVILITVLGLLSPVSLFSLVVAGFLNCGLYLVDQYRLKWMQCVITQYISAFGCLGVAFVFNAIKYNNPQESFLPEKIYCFIDILN